MYIKVFLCYYIYIKLSVVATTRWQLIWRRNAWLLQQSFTPTLTKHPIVIFVIVRSSCIVYRYIVAIVIVPSNTIARYLYYVYRGIDRYTTYILCVIQRSADDTTPPRDVYIRSIGTAGQLCRVCCRLGRACVCSHKCKYSRDNHLRRPRVRFSGR